MENKKADTKKIQFEFSPDAYKRLEHLQEETDAATKAEVVRKALRLYEWFVTQVGPTALLVVEDQEGNNLYKIPASALR